MSVFVKVLKTSALILCMFSLIIIVFYIYNLFALKQEKGEIVPNGQMVDVGGYKLHVYSQGNNDNSPTLVFLSGSGTTAPVYDFKSLYSLLSDEYRIAVVEKPGYGYSEQTDKSRDLDTMVNEVRKALIGANISAPYILVPHSMSGLEAIYWAQNYPKEVAGIVGIDMAVYNSYGSFDFSKVKDMSFWGTLGKNVGIFRIPGIVKLNTENLSDTEIKQQKLLMHKNFVNEVYINEASSVNANCESVKSSKIKCPIMMFSSLGKDIGDYWPITQEQFAKENNAELIVYDCGHYIHHYKSKEMKEKIVEFIKKIQNIKDN